MLSKIIVATALGLATAQSGSGSGFGSGSGSGADTTLADCECQTSWTHNEYMCNSSQSGRRTKTMKGCPSIEDLEQCEYDPQQTWCKTTQDSCKQQVGDMVDDGWAYCNNWYNADDNSGRAYEPQGELPMCTCKSKWSFSEGICAQNPIQVNGCPTIEQIQQCLPNVTDSDQSWCSTNEVLCREQEDNSYTTGTGEEMVNQSWAYCSPFYQETELPACECDESWTVEASTCSGGSGRETTFTGCPTTAKMSECEGSAVYAGAEQTWCQTTFARCREQTYSMVDDSETMVNESWSYCWPDDDGGLGKSGWPNCECMDTWSNADDDCARRGNAKVFSGCPTTAELSECASDVTQSWCDTTFMTCEQQNFASDGEQWAYCDTATDMGELAECECKDKWKYREDDCNPWHGGMPRGMKGCPTLEAVQSCDPEATMSWCDTKDQFCKEQTGDQIGAAWVNCDPQTQGGVPQPATDTDVGEVVGNTVGVTLLICACIFFGLCVAYRKYAQRHKADYSELSQTKLMSSEKGMRPNDAQLSW